MSNDGNTFDLNSFMKCGGWQTEPLPNLASESVLLVRSHLSLLACSEGDNRLYGEHRLSFLCKSEVKLLGVESMATLFGNPELIPEDWKLKAGTKTRYITFDGEVLIYPDGKKTRAVLYLYWDGNKFRKGIQNLDASFASTCLAAVYVSQA